MCKKMEQNIHIKQTYKQKYNFTKISLLFVPLMPSLFCHSILYGLVDVEWHYICGRKSSVLAYVRINHILCMYVWFSSIRRTIRIEKSHLKIAICSWSENKLRTTKEETMKGKCTKKRKNRSNGYYWIYSLLWTSSKDKTHFKTHMPKEWKTGEMSEQNIFIRLSFQTFYCHHSSLISWKNLLPNKHQFHLSKRKFF